MNSKRVKRARKQSNDQVENIEITGTPAGLAKTHRIIRTEKDKEIQFIKLCSQIKLQDFKETRKENQRTERREKRKSY